MSAPSSTVESAAPAAAASPALASRRALCWTLLLLFLVNMMNYVDRLLFSVAQEAVKTELRLTDFQLGLVGGPAFALLYTLFTFPIARLADRTRRVSIVAGALALWSGMTAACGLATGFAHMLAGRAGVSIGEAGCTPASHSLIADAFPPARRTLAMSVFVAAGPTGGMLAAIGGGLLIQAHGWRSAFLLCGLSGLAIATLFLLTVPEPPRTTRDTPSLAHTIRLLLAKRGFVLVALACGVAGIGSYSNQQYMVSFLVRAHGLPLATASTVMGLVVGLVGIVMTMLCGWVMDRGRGRFPAIRVRLPALGLLWCGAFDMVAFQVPSAGLAIGLLLAAALGQHFYMPATFTLGQDMAPPRMRAMASAIIIATSSLLGYGIGPPLIGWLSDVLAHRAAGMLPAGADCARLATQACAAASAQGLRLSLSAGSACFVLAALLFVRAGRHVPGDLEPD